MLLLLHTFKLIMVLLGKLPSSEYLTPSKVSVRELPAQSARAAAGGEITPVVSKGRGNL